MEVLIENYILELKPTTIISDVLNYNTNKLIYFDSKKKLNSVHNGQRKLFYSLLKFISIINRKDFFEIVYIGAAPGRNIVQVAKIFQNIKFHLFDTFKEEDLKFITDQNLQNIVIYNKYFEESDAEKFKNIYLFSDIRNLSFSKNEDDILKDLEIQKKFVYFLNPILFSLKFRIPYNLHKINYLDGLCYIQPFTKNLSTEVRLIGKTKNEKKYFLKEHEMKMFYINIVLREFYFVNLQNKIICFNEFLEFNLAKDLEMTYDDYCYNVNQFTHNKKQEKQNTIRDYIKNLNYKYEGINIFRCLENETSESKNDSLKNKSDEISEIEKSEQVSKIRTNSNIFFKNIDTEKFNEKLFLKSITHSSASDTNYEIFEYVGDRVLNVFISEYIVKNFEYDILLYSGILSSFASGEMATLVFSFYLELDKLLITHNNKFDKQLEDILESLLGYIKKEYGLEAAKMIVYGLLDKIDFNEYIENIFPPKSELKEFYDKKVKEGSELYKFKENYNVNASTKIVDEWTESRFSVRLKIPDLNKTLLFTEFGTEKKIETLAVNYFLDFMEKENIYKRRTINKIIKIKIIDTQTIDEEIFNKFITLILDVGDLRSDRLNYIKKESKILINPDALIFHGDRILKLTISDYIETTYKGNVKLFNGIIATILTEDIFDKDIKLLLALVDKIFNKQYNLLGLEQCYVIVTNILDSINLNDENYKDKIFPPKTMLLEILKYYDRNINLYSKDYDEVTGNFKVNLDLSSFNMISPFFVNIIYDTKIKNELQKKYEFEASKYFLKYLRNRGYVGNPFSTNFTIVRKNKI